MVNSVSKVPVVSYVRHYCSIAFFPASLGSLHPTPAQDGRLWEHWLYSGCWPYLTPFWQIPLLHLKRDSIPNKGALTATPVWWLSRRQHHRQRCRHWKRKNTSQMTKCSQTQQALSAEVRGQPQVCQPQAPPGKGVVLGEGDGGRFHGRQMSSPFLHSVSEPPWHPGRVGPSVLPLPGLFLCLHTNIIYLVFFINL